MDRSSNTAERRRRTCRTVTSAVMVRATLGRLVLQSEAAQRHPQQGHTPHSYTLRIHTMLPDVPLPSNVMHYPANLQAPDAFDTASEHPIGTGSFTFVSWTRWNELRLVRFANYWETDAEGHNLPYLDAIIARPKREDEVKILCEMAQTAVAVCVPPILGHNQDGVATLASAPLCSSAGASFGDDGASHTDNGL